MSGQVALSDSRRFASPESPFSRTRNNGAFDAHAFSRSASQNNPSGDWDSPSRLTFSIAPDGTGISDYTSSLFDSFSNLLDQTRLEQTLSNAFQTWSSNSSINFGKVTDSGDPFGVPGLSQGDSRFGDIRIGAIPLGDEVFAVATPFQLGISGTWSGDILFNANAKFKSRDHFLAVATHEIGHALGMEHSSGRNDVMNPAALNTRLSPAETLMVQEKYGMRALDQYDAAGKDNNSIDNATRIHLAGSLKGDIPLLAFGDIANRSDVDFFELRNYSGYSGDVSIRVVTKGISQLAPAISVFDESGSQIAHAASAAIDGDDLTITIVPKADDDKFFIRINGLNKHREFGSYGLVTTFNADANYDPVVLENVLRQDLWNLEQEDVHTLFISPSPVFNDDLHTNDTFATATVLAPLAGSVTEENFRVQAGLTDSLDVDFYRFRSPDAAATLTVTLASMEQLGLVGNLQVFDANFVEQSHRVINNGNGRLVIQVDGTESEQDYVVAVRADRPGKAMDTGNYTLDLTFRHEALVLDEIAQGSLGVRNPMQIHTLFVAETQMFNLGIDAVATSDPGEQVIWMTMYSESGEVVHRAVTRPGEFRSAHSIVLQPGTYSIRTTLAFPGSPNDPAGNTGPLNYTIQGTGITDPMGPELLTPARKPFPQCNPLTREYCYPGDRHTTDPYLVVFGNESDLPTDGTTPPDYDDVNAWYWYQNWANDPQG